MVHRGREIKVAGISFLQDIASAVLGATPNWSGMVALVPDPGNEVDGNAVAIWHTKGQLGWLPREIAADVAEDLLEVYQYGVAAVARAEVFLGRGPLIGARVRLAQPFRTRPP